MAAELAFTLKHALSFAADLAESSEQVFRSSPLLADDLLERLRPLFAPGREVTGDEVSSAVFASFARFGFHLTVLPPRW